MFGFPTVAPPCPKCGPNSRKQFVFDHARPKLTGWWCDSCQGKIPVKEPPAVIRNDIIDGCLKWVTDPKTGKVYLSLVHKDAPGEVFKW